MIKSIDSLPKVIILLLVLGGSLTYLISMDNRQRLLQTSWNQQIPLMGTVVAITIRGINKETAKIAFKRAFTVAHEIDQRISTYKKDSEVSQINRHFKRANTTNPANTSTAIELSHKTATLFKTSFEYAHVTEGAFDPTVKPLIDIWRTAKKEERLPSKELINATKPQHIAAGASLQNTTLTAPPNTMWDFGGIGKGYTADLIAAELESLGIYNYLIDIGRDLLVRGHDAAWKIGIQDPLNKDASIQTLIIRRKTAIATSGDYEQQYIIETHKLTHIIDPRTGWPIHTIAGATVIAPTGAEADALATAFTVLSPAKSIELANKLTGVEALILRHDNDKTGRANKDDNSTTKATILSFYSQNWPKGEQ